MSKHSTDTDTANRWTWKHPSLFVFFFSYCASLLGAGDEKQPPAVINVFVYTAIYFNFSY